MVLTDRRLQKSRRQLPLIQKLNMKFDIERIKVHYLKKVKEAPWDACLCTVPSPASSDQTGYYQVNLTSPTGQASLGPDVVNGSWEWFSAKKEGPIRGENYRKYIESPPENSIFHEKAFSKKTEIFDSFWEEILGAFRGKPTRVRFAKLLPGFQLHPHIDYDTTFSIRIHIPILTNSKSHIGIRRSPKNPFEQHHLPADGSAYFVNQGHEHYAKNEGESERVHLIVSVEGQDDLLIT